MKIELGPAAVIQLAIRGLEMGNVEPVLALLREVLEQLEAKETAVTLKAEQ